MATVIGTNWGDWCVNSWHFRAGIEVDETSRDSRYVYYSIYGYAQSTQTVISYGQARLSWTEDGGSTWHYGSSELGADQYPVVLSYGATITAISSNTYWTRVQSGTRSVGVRHEFWSPGANSSTTQYWQQYREGSSATVWFTVPQLESHTVSYNANGGSGAPSSQTKWYGSTLTLSSTKPTWTGHTFQGWATSSTGSVVYQPGGTYGADSDVTLYAIWKIDTYTVSYNANGGNDSSVPASQTKTYGSNLTLSSTKPTWTGNTFQGWATSATGSVAYQPGGTFTTNANTVLYAVWKKNTYTVSFNANGGTGSIASQTKTYGVNLTLTKNTTITKTNYLFQGWGKTASDTTPTWSDGGTYSDNASATLYAIWKQNVFSCTIKFDANGGTDAPASITHWSKSYSTLPSSAPTKSGYKFQGWASTSSASAQKWISGGLYYNDSFTAGATITLYAVWKQDPFFTPNVNLQQGQTVKDVQIQLPSGSTAIKDVCLSVGYLNLQTSDGNALVDSASKQLSVNWT